MEIDGTASGITVNLIGLTLENGNGTGTNDSGSGGGLLIYAQSGNKATVAITNSTLSGNSATNGSGGGGIYNDGYGGAATVTISNSTLSGSSAADGGGIFNAGYNSGSATVTISNSTLSGNSASSGGGIWNDGSGSGSATLTITNSTISGNLASYKGGGIFNDGPGGGSATLTITNSTISGNSADFDGGGIYSQGDGGSATLTIGDTILAGNTSGGNESDYSSTFTTLTDNGYNLFGQSGDSGGFTGNGTTDILLSGNISTVLQTDLLGNPLLANNGGPTETIALVLGSPAIDAGDPTLIGTTDQRGIVRGSPAAGTGSASDIGAYEAAIIDVTANNQTITYGQSLPTLTYTVTSGPSGPLTGSVAPITPETNAGTYVGDIGQGTLAVTNPVYLLDFTAGTLVIDKATLTITANTGETKTYGLSASGVVLPTPAYTVTGLATGDSFSGEGRSSTGDAPTANAGSYDVTTSGGTGTLNATSAGQTGGTFANDYTIVHATTAGALTVNAATLTITVAPGSSFYGQNLTGLVPGLTVTGLVNGNTVAGLGYTSVITGTGGGITPTTNVGSYNLTIGGSLTDSNYAVSVSPVGKTTTWSVTPDLITIAGLTSGFSTYGFATGFNGSTYFTVSDEDNSANVGTFVKSTKATLKATAKSNAGTYAVQIAGSLKSVGGKVNGVSAKDYKVVLQSGSWKINQQAVTITIGNGSSVYGASPTVPVLTATGSVNGKSTALTNTQLQGYSTDLLTVIGATGNSGVGGNPYTIDLTGAGTGNYTASNPGVTASWTVTPATITVTALKGKSVVGTNPTYGNATGDFGYSFTGFVNGDTLGSTGILPDFSESPVISSSTPKGSYTIVVNQTTIPLSDPNYIAKLVSGKWSVAQ